LLALKRARRAGIGIVQPAAEARIAEAERLLINRMCRGGGWNFGNAAVMQQDLRPYVPTTALGLLAMADRPGEPAVQTSRDFLARAWNTEPSSQAMSLSLLSLDGIGAGGAAAEYGKAADAVEPALREHAARARAFGNFHLLAMTRFALASRKRDHAFKV
jgi:hypothetical protein